MSVLKDEAAMKELPYYKSILRSFLRKQIGALLEEMATETGEESIILMANSSAGTTSCLGSSKAKPFIEENTRIQKQFLSYCLKGCSITASREMRTPKSAKRRQENIPKDIRTPKQAKFSDLSSVSMNVSDSSLGGCEETTPVMSINSGPESIPSETPSLILGVYPENAEDDSLNRSDLNSSMDSDHIKETVNIKVEPLSDTSDNGIIDNQTTSTDIKTERELQTCTQIPQSQGNECSDVNFQTNDLSFDNSMNSMQSPGTPQTFGPIRYENSSSPTTEPATTDLDGVRHDHKYEKLGEIKIETLAADIAVPKAVSEVDNSVKSSSEVCQFRSVDIDTFVTVTENQNQNTQKKTEQDMKTFNSFLSYKKEDRLVQCIPPDTLEEYLCEFLLSVRRKNGQEYEPTTLRGFICSIDRHLTQHNSKVCIAIGREFKRVRDVLKSKQKGVKKQCFLSNKPKTALALTDEHLEMMYKAQTLGDYSARSLSHSMWYICAAYFGLRTGAEIHNMKWGDVSLEIDPCSGRQFLMLCKERQAKTKTGANVRDTKTNQPKAYAISGDPQRDPIHLYKTYRDRRPITMLAEDAPFFLAICTPFQKGWYKTSAMGINKLYNVMNEMKADAGIEEA